jgi:MFS family permease
VSRPVLPIRVTVTLGIVTIVGFGVWLYGYGVLLEPIREDTGWSEAVLSSTYGVSLLGAGLLATFAGSLLHRRGSRVVYVTGAGLVAASYLATAAASSGRSRRTRSGVPSRARSSSPSWPGWWCRRGGAPRSG